MTTRSGRNAAGRRTDRVATAAGAAKAPPRTTSGRSGPARLACVALAVVGAVRCIGGCATVTTVQSATNASARVFSGTRLDLLAVTGQPIPARLFRAAPPPYPLLDLPFSFMLDVLVLPLTLTGGAVRVSR